MSFEIILHLLIASFVFFHTSYLAIKSLNADLGTLFTLFINLDFNNSSALSLYIYTLFSSCSLPFVYDMCTSLGSSARHESTNSLIAGENVSGSLGGVDFGMIDIARIGSTLAKGGLPVAISYTVIPKDQISAYIVP